MEIFTFNDLLYHFPYRYIDRTKIVKIRDVNEFTDDVQVSGTITDINLIGQKWSKRLEATLFDGSQTLTLVWFQGVSWLQKMIVPGQKYLVYGSPGFFNGQLQMAHPEIELLTAVQQGPRGYMEPVYPSTEKLKARGMGGRQLARLTEALWAMLKPDNIQEVLPEYIINGLHYPQRFEAFRQIHFPHNEALKNKAVERLKFEELFFSQFKLQQTRNLRHRFSKGVVFEKVGDLFLQFYEKYLPFELTNAQKRVIKELRVDTGSGKQMNRLLQGDVGSGKTIVALLMMLLAIDNGYQACLMAPTEILARQHFESITTLVKELPVTVKLLTGSTRVKERRPLLEELENGTLHILVGTHAVLEDPVIFKKLGLVIIDEQHRFGVAQRARLWKKAQVPPHVLVMTATPIPRTLAMTFYGDLDYSVIDEMPKGRQPITTVHRYENKRSEVLHFVKSEIDSGRQAYVVFPLIDESEKSDLENLMRGYEIVKTYFPEPLYYISMVHGKQPAAQKDTNMQRFAKNDTQVLVGTTVIEVGINVPNATVMVIENADRFGLSQLHQLRGRVGRGADKSYCILLTSSKVSADARERLKILTQSNNGFVIAEKDLELRGPGQIEGTRQSGIINFKLANIKEDRALLEKAVLFITDILKTDSDLLQLQHQPLKQHLQGIEKGSWGKIS